MIIDLKGMWDFTYTPSLGRHLRLPAPNAFTTRMPVPGYWDERLDDLRRQPWWPQARWLPPDLFRTTKGALPAAQDQQEFATAYYLEGIGWYRRRIRLPAAFAKGSRLLFECGEIMAYAHLWVNGRYAGGHTGCRANFSIDLTRFVRPAADNEIMLAIGNDHIDTTAVDFKAGYCGGVIGSMRLRVTGPGAISDLFVRAGADPDTVAWTVRVNVPQKRAYALDWTIRDKAGGAIIARGRQPFAAMGQADIEWTCRAPAIRPWQIGASRLYHAEVTLRSGGVVWDTFARRFGVRRWACVESKLKLNGQVVFLRGNCDSANFPQHASTPFDKDFYRQYAGRLKAMGFNLMKFLFYQPPQVCFEVADELGLAVQVSLEYKSDARTRTKAFQDQAVREIAGLVRTLRNYPSVSIYRLSGEQYCDEAFIAFLRRIYDVIKREDPGALVLAAHAARGITYSINLLDQHILMEPYPINAERLSRLGACSDIMVLPSSALSYGCPGDEGWRRVDQWAASIYPRRVVFSHENGMKGSYLDLRNERRYTSRFPPVYYTRLRRQLEAAGMLEKAGLYYRMSSRLQQVARKYAVEEARLCRTLAGYEYLGDSDHFNAYFSYPAGFTDEFGKLKPGDSFASIARYQNESVLLLDMPDRKRRTAWSGGEFSATWKVSLFGPRDIPHGTLTWQLCDGLKVLLEDRVPFSDIVAGGVSLLASCLFRWPALTSAAKLKLRGTLTGAGYRIANDWDFWIFPRREAPRVNAACDPGALETLSSRYEGLAGLKAALPLRIVSCLAAGDVEHLRGGGRVLLLGTHPFAAWPMYYYLGTGHASQAAANVGTVIHPHPVFRDIPHEGFGDWQFLAMLHKKSSCAYFNDPGLPFDPILEVISSDKDVRKQASLFEATVGRGCLFVAACSWDLRDAAAATLMDSILRHVQGAEFKPRAAMAPGKILSMIKANRTAPAPARSIIPCPRVARLMIPVRQRPGHDPWRRAGQCVSEFALSQRAMTAAEKDYNAGAGAVLSPSASQCKQEQRRFRTRLAFLHDGQFLGLRVDVTSIAGFARPRDMGCGAHGQNDYVMVMIGQEHYAMALTSDGPFITCSGVDLMPAVSLGITRRAKHLSYELLLPLPKALKEDRFLDLTVKVFHMMPPPGLKKDAYCSLPRDVVPFDLKLDLAGKAKG